MNRYLIANWKLNLPPEGMDIYFGELVKSRVHDGIVVAAAPPYPYLERARRSAEAAGLQCTISAQDCSVEEKGAFTGDVSAAMIRDFADMVIIGHSERRNLRGDTDEIVAAKITRALHAGLTPVICIGEQLNTRDAGKTAYFLSGQIRAVADALRGASQVILAYEPIWAIGTGRNASGATVAQTTGDIRRALEEFWPAPLGTEVPILYGGSVTPENVAELTREGGVDGYLVGGASLSSAKFAAIGEGLRSR